MFCPQCGAKQSEELKFCKQCGANLHAVRLAVTTRETDEKFDWSKTWVAEMFLSESELQKREQQLEHQRGITPEVKRYKEIKAGVIVACIGIGLATFLYFLMQGIILSGNVSSSDAQILSRIWIAGVIPILIGSALMINGIFISKKIVAALREEIPAKAQLPQMAGATAAEGDPRALLCAADTKEVISPDFSVTESTTRHLHGSTRHQ